MTRRLPAALLVLAAACGGSDAPAPSPSPTTASATPTRSATPTPTRTATPSPSASPTGVPLGTAGSYLRLTSGDQTIANVASCEEAYPELLDVSCDAITMDGGSMLWVAGTRDGRWVLRLHTFVGGSYVLRYEAADPAGTWGGFRVGAARLTGYGVDGLVAQVVHQGPERRRGYDILTWRKGGPLVLRAHRPDAPELRVVARENRLDDYEAAGSRFDYRQVRWDGSRFVVVAIGKVAASQVPPAA